MRDDNKFLGSKSIIFRDDPGKRKEKRISKLSGRGLISFFSIAWNQRTCDLRADGVSCIYEDSSRVLEHSLSRDQFVQKSIKQDFKKEPRDKTRRKHKYSFLLGVIQIYIYMKPKKDNLFYVNDDEGKILITFPFCIKIKRSLYLEIQ